MAVCVHPLSFELMDCQGTFLQQIPKMSIDEQMLKQLAEVFESDKKSKLSAEFPEVGPSGASAYLGQAGGDYDRAREMLVAVYQRFKERNAQHVHQLKAELQDAQQATEQAEFERDGAVAEGVHLTQQRDEFQNMVQDLVEENVAFKAEAAMANIKFSAMEVEYKELQRESQNARTLIATLKQENRHRDEQAQGKLAECQAQVANLRGIVAELRSEAAADMGHKVEVLRVRGMLDGKQQQIEALKCRLASSQTRLQLQGHVLAGTRQETQQEIEALKCRLADSQTRLQLQGHVLAGTRTQLQETQHELADSQGRLQALQHELSHTQERLQGKVEQLEAKVERITSKLTQMMTRCWEVERKYHKSEETLATLRRAMDTNLARRSKMFNDMFDTMFKGQLDLIGENELLKHNHAALERKLNTMQRELDISNQWRLEEAGELDKVTDELTLFKETLHAQGLRLPNRDPFVVSHPPLGLEE